MSKIGDKVPVLLDERVQHPFIHPTSAKVLRRNADDELRSIIGKEARSC